MEIRMSTHFVAGVVVGVAGYWAYTRFVRRPKPSM